MKVLRPTTPLRSTWQVISLPSGTFALPLETLSLSAGPLAETTSPPKAVRSQVRAVAEACPLLRETSMVKSDRGVVESFFAFMVKRPASLAAPSIVTFSVVTVV